MIKKNQEKISKEMNELALGQEEIKEKRGIKGNRKKEEK